MSFVSGARVGVYEVVSALGEGGMGEVYRARDTRLGREVAIKVLSDAWTADPDRAARFEREAQALAALNHPHIAALYGFEQVDGRSFLVMELVEGDTLADRVQRGPMRVEAVLAVMRQIAEALEAAHEKGIVHRDLKPANVKITPDDRVKVLDFGLAKLGAGEPGGAGGPGEPGRAGGAALNVSQSPTLSIMATQAGIIMGTAAYMSPEQAQGLPVDARSDVFSFGVVFYELLTGRQPFQGETVAAILASVLIREPELSSLPPNLNPRLIELLKRCLDKNPKKRWHAVADLRAEIETIAMAPHATALPAATAAPRLPMWRRAAPVVAASVLFAALGAGAAWRLRTPTTQPIIRFAMPLEQGQRFSRNGALAISPDGKTFAFVANEELWLRDAAGLDSRAIPGTKLDPFREVFSPDGQWLAFFAFADNTLKKVPITGGTPITLCKLEGTAAYGISWSGDRVLFADPARGIMRVSVNGGEPETLVPTKPPEVADGPQMLDDDSLLFSVTTDTSAERWDKAQIVLLALKSGQRKVLGRGALMHASRTHLIYAVGTTVFAVPFDAKAGAVRGSAVPLLENVTRAGAPSSQSAIASWALSETGTLMYSSSVSAVAMPVALAFVDRDGKVEPLDLPLQPYYHPRLSPDGDQLAVHTDDGKRQIVWVYNFKTGGALRQLTFDGNNSFPIWTPDGRSITFRSDRGGDRGVYQQPADGSRPAERLTTVGATAASHTPEAWTPDGKTLIYRVQSATSRLWTFTASTRTSQPLEETSAIQQQNSSLSPDGRWLAYTLVASSSAQPQVVVEPFPPNGARYQIQSRIAASPRWAHTGRELFFDDGASTGRVMVVGVRVGSGLEFSKAEPVPTPGIQKPSAAWRPYDVSLDDRRVLIATAAAQSGNAAAPSINVVVNWTEELNAKVPVR